MFWGIAGGRGFGFLCVSTSFCACRRCWWSCGAACVHGGQWLLIGVVIVVGRSAKFCKGIHCARIGGRASRFAEAGASHRSGITRVVGRKTCADNAALNFKCAFVHSIERLAPLHLHQHHGEFLRTRLISVGGHVLLAASVLISSKPA